MRQWTTWGWNMLVAVGLAGAGGVEGQMVQSQDFELRPCPAIDPGGELAPGHAKDEGQEDQLE